MSTTKDAVLEIKNLTKHYGNSRGIEKVDLEIVKGEIFGFLGPNGAGKSTTINTILDILRPSEGSVTILGYDHKNVKKTHRLIGYLAGDMTTDPSLTGKQYLAFVAKAYGNVDPERKAHLIRRLKVDTSTKIKHLSRGNRQKIGLVAALMHNPEILILDEPTSGLDPLIQAQFNQILQEHKQAGKTAFISSHVLSEVQEICDRVGFIRDGKLIEVRSLADLLREASQRVTIAFKSEPPLGKLGAVKGVGALSHDGQTIAFDFNGNINDLLKLISTHAIENMEITEANLEDLFMQYYTEEDQNV